MTRIMIESSTFVLHAKTYFDAKAKAFRENISIVVDRQTGAICDVIQRSSAVVTIQDGDIDLRDKIVMPGFVDAHTHIYLHSYSERASNEQMRDESIIERTVRANKHCQRALLSGYTTYRDLGTEGMRSFDTNLRDAINRGLIGGPRLFVATEALATSGSYEVRTENSQNGTRAPPIADVCDGVTGVRQAVRRRVGAGADIIKFYGDYRRQPLRFPQKDMMFPPSSEKMNPSTVMFSQEEMDAIVDEAKRAGLAVACHAGTDEGARMAAKAGVTSVEHGHEITNVALEEMKRNGTIYVPTLAVIEMLQPDSLQTVLKTAKKAFDMGIRLAAGGDTGAFNHGHGARELQLMAQAGIPLEHVLEACMIGGWDACGQDGCGYRFGWFAKGNRADVIALDRDPRHDPDALKQISFVMKDAKVWKQDGIPVGFINELLEDAGQPARSGR